jgi:prephenate dehydrogenase
MTLPLPSGERAGVRVVLDMKKVAIIGLGLMGGSLGLALKRRGLATVSASARREETRRMALSMGAADEVFETPQAAIRGADVVVFCTPVCSIPELSKACLAAFEPGCVVTDVGSTKSDLAREMPRLFKGTNMVFVGSHPMAGSEKTGLEVANAGLYEGAVTALTPVAGTPESAIMIIEALWQGVGAKVVRLAPDAHDELVARSSHLPHLIAALLVATAGRNHPADLSKFCGPGFQSTTRVAAGSPEMWHDIVKTNRAAILAELHAYQAELGQLISAIEKQDYCEVKSFLERARTLRQELLG